MKPLPMAPTEKVIDSDELDALGEATSKILTNERKLREEWEKPLTFRGNGLHTVQRIHKRTKTVWKQERGNPEGSLSVASGILWIQGPMGPSLCYHKPRKQVKPKCKCMVCGSVHNRKGG